jgi:hypothetical protein
MKLNSAERGLRVQFAASKRGQQTLLSDGIMKLNLAGQDNKRIN